MGMWKTSFNGWRDLTGKIIGPLQTSLVEEEANLGSLGEEEGKQSLETIMNWINGILKGISSPLSTIVARNKDQKFWRRKKSTMQHQG
jgi:hypothetical protein